MKLLALDHVQLAMPKGEEEKARAFYVAVLGLAEVEKPPHLAARGGCWFQESSVRIHLGVADPFIPAKKAHPAFVVDDLDDLVAIAKAAGYPAVDDQPLAGFRRKYLSDPFGNRIEIMQRIGEEK